MHVRPLGRSIALSLGVALGVSACAGTYRRPGVQDAQPGQAQTVRTTVPLQAPLSRLEEDALDERAPAMAGAGREDAMLGEDLLTEDVLDDGQPRLPDALPPAAPEAAQEPPGGLAAQQPESLLALIDSSTPPHAAAALRLVEDGRQRAAEGRYDEALERFQRAVAIDPSNGVGVLVLAHVHDET